MLLSGAEDWTKRYPEVPPSWSFLWFSNQGLWEKFGGLVHSGYPPPFLLWKQKKKKKSMIWFWEAWYNYTLFPPSHRPYLTVKHMRTRWKGWGGTEIATVKRLFVCLYKHHQIIYKPTMGHIEESSCWLMAYQKVSSSMSLNVDISLPSPLPFISIFCFHHITWVTFLATKWPDQYNSLIFLIIFI